MDWFIKKGATVQEDKPTRLWYSTRYLVSIGHPGVVKCAIYVCSDPANTGAPQYSDMGQSIHYFILTLVAVIS